MKKNILFISFLLFLFGETSYSQVIVFHEDFEVVDSMSSTGVPTWFRDSNYHTDGTHCIRDTVGINGTGYLTSDAFSTAGNFFVLLTFDQICKINFADHGYVEVSSDNGTTWTTLSAIHYLGPSAYFPSFSYFSSFSYGANGWDAAHDTTDPLPSWWRTEFFDISSVAANSPQVKIRFRITDGNGNGNSGNYGWLIDHVSVQAAPHELVPPVIRWSPPVLQGTIYSIGPFTVSDTITDSSPFGSATLYYTINGGTPVAVTMTNTGNIYHGIIPAVTVGDTVCYYVRASDSWGNTSVLPSTGCISFVTSAGISFPYADNFDLNNLWHDSTHSGSHWQLGTPAFGLTTGAHSAPNAWDVDLNSGYLGNTTTYLVSPIFNFIGVYNATLSFWRNHNCEGDWDGVRVEYTTNGINWLLLGSYGDPLGTNWYNYTNINSNPGPAFSGISGGWVQSKYILQILNNTAGPVRIRFVFTSDPSIEADGFSIDDLSIAQPSPHDVGITTILRPGISAPGNLNDSVRIVIHNFGSDTTANFQVAYRINNGSAVFQNHPGVLQPGTNDTITFSTPYLVPPAMFVVCAWTSLSNDGNHLNDTTCKNSFGILRFTIPYTDPFNSLNDDWSDSSAAGTNWQLGIPNFGLTNSAHSNPYAWDINLTTAYGVNAYSVLTSPLFDFTNQYNVKLSFWMNRNIATGDGAFLEYSLNSGNSWQRLGVVNDPNALNTNWYGNPNINFTNLPGWDGSSGGWIKYLYVLGIPFNNAGPNVRFRFVFTSNGFTAADGISIDDIALIPSSPVDLGITLINQPGISSASGSTATVNVSFKNFGSSVVTGANLAYTVNGVLISTEPWSGVIPPSATGIFSFAAPFTVPNGTYTICAYTLLGTDGDHTNDTTCKSSIGIPLFTIPYLDTFDTSAVVWFDSSANTGTNWQHGTPAFGQTTGSFSPPSCWDVNLTFAYNDNALSYLISPFFNFTGLTNARLSFWQNRNTESGWDGTRLEYSINGGASWAVLGIYNDPGAVNWYTKPSINSSLLPAWDGISMNVSGIPGWQQSIYLSLPSTLYGQFVQFRFVFTSDGSITRDGVSIDDFRLWVPPVDVPSVETLSGHFTVYPNPSDGVFYLYREAWMKNNSSIVVSDILGKEVWKGSLNKSSDLFPIDLSSKPNGIYLLSITSDDITGYQKIVLCK